MTNEAKGRIARDLIRGTKGLCESTLHDELSGINCLVGELLHQRGVSDYRLLLLDGALDCSLGSYDEELQTGYPCYDNTYETTDRGDWCDDCRARVMLAEHYNIEPDEVSDLISMNDRIRKVDPQERLIQVVNQLDPTALQEVTYEQTMQHLSVCEIRTGSIVEQNVEVAV